MSTPPPVLVNNQAAQTKSWCRADPASCIRQVGIEAGFLATAYVFLLFATGSQVPRPWSILKFLLIFALLSFAGRLLSDGLGDKMSITAVSGLGGKMVSILAKGFVGW